MQTKPLTKDSTFLVKSLKKVGVEGNFFTMITGLYERYTTKIRNKRSLLLPLLFNIVLEILVRVIR